MKKFIFSAALLALSFLTFSFKLAQNSVGDYDIQTELNTLNTGLAKSFSSAHTHKSDKDVVWSEWHKQWTLTSTGDDIKDIEAVLAKY